MARLGFIVDLNRCTGCRACEIACTIENRLPWTTSWRHVRTVAEPSRPDAPRYHLSIACNHCEHPACSHACPASAYRRDERTGVLTLDAERCIGCGYCAWACPFDAPVLDERAGVMTKCTLCSHRPIGDEPACARSCPTGALRCGDLDEASELIDRVPGFPGVELAPAMRFVPLREGHERPEMLGDEVASQAPQPRPASPGLSLATEWPLAVFTFLITTLVAWFAAATAFAAPLHPVAFAAVAVVALTASTLHLGRPTRAWRAILGWRTSLLSREVALVSAFLALSIPCTIWPVPAWLPWLAAAVGLAALFAIDAVYLAVQRSHARWWHGAGAVLTGAFLTAVFGAGGWFVVVLGGAKLVEFVSRRLVAPFAFVRLGLGLAVLAAAILGEGGLPAWAILAALVAEAIDRAQFYAGYRTR